MVKGLDLFREKFRAHTEQYALIGGAACDLIMEEAGLAFRATKDLDIVLIVEAMSHEPIDLKNLEIRNKPIEAILGELRALYGCD